jgi:hypothetical protein
MAKKKAMKKENKVQIQNGGRQQKPIDWNLVDELLEAGCHGTEIAPNFDLTYERFYERVVEKYNMSFTEYSQKIRQKGESCLRKVQYDEAIKNKNTPLLIWLGKCRLKQRDSDDSNLIPINDNSIAKDHRIMALEAEIESLKATLDNKPKTE